MLERFEGSCNLLLDRLGVSRAGGDRFGLGEKPPKHGVELVIRKPAALK
jgi:hypothetical protein